MVTAWNPSLDITGGSNNFMTAFGFSGSTVYMGGQFEHVGINPRKGLAAVDDSLGNVLPWNPNAGNSYLRYGFNGFTMAVSGSTVYVGGNFNSVGTTERRGLVAIDALTGIVTSWDPVLNIPIFTTGITSMQVEGSTLYIGGALTVVGENPRTGIAAIDIPTATALSWNPQLTRPISSSTAPIAFSFAVDTSNSLMYVAGNFTIINNGDAGYRFANVSLPEITAIAAEDDAGQPGGFVLEQNYPNPFNPSTIINYSIPTSGFVSLDVYNLLGKRVSSLVNKFQEAGTYKINFDASLLSSGVYFYSLRYGTYNIAKKMILLR